MSGDDRARPDAVGAPLRPLGCIARLEEVANALLWLCSNGASWAAGADIALHGAYSMLGRDRGLGAKGMFAEFDS